MCCQCIRLPVATRDLVNIASDLPNTTVTVVFKIRGFRASSYQYLDLSTKLKFKCDDTLDPEMAQAAWCL